MSGVYQITATGLLVGQATRDSPAPGIDPDGKGDEAYAAAYVRRFDRRSLQMLETSVRQTLPYGDVSGYGASRLQGGTQTPTGGLRAGDRIPALLSTARQIPAGGSAFPMKIWDGRLTDGVDALLISPTVWEYDGGTSIWTDWVQSQSVLNNTITSDPAVQNRIASRVFGTIEAGVIVPRLPNLPELIINGRQDSPVGMRATGGVPGFAAPTYSLPHTMVVLTREIIEQALAAAWPRVMPTAAPGVMLDVPKPGILVLSFFDQGSGAQAAYSLVLQVERLEGDPRSATDVTKDEVEKRAIEMLNQSNDTKQRLIGAGTQR